tara:strand:- start:3651 stop:3809 length:159 start_codon:yes stop_codon:yes gene_type:complete
MAEDVENHHPLASAAMVDLSRSTVTDTSFTSLMTGPLWGERRIGVAGDTFTA